MPKRNLVARVDTVDFYCYKSERERLTGHHTYRVRWDIEEGTFTLQKWNYPMYEDAGIVQQVKFSSDVLTNAHMLAQDMLTEVLTGVDVINEDTMAAIADLAEDREE